MRRLSRLGAALALASFATVAGVALAPMPSGADTSLVGWSATADANTFDLVVDNASGLAGSHPLSEIDIPEDASSYETGPLGHSLAAVFWPGAVAGNIGSLSGELPIPAQLASILGMLNDPVRAESFYPSGPASAVYPAGAPANGPAEMTSTADANSSTAKSGLVDSSLPGLFDLQGVLGSSSATANTQAQASATGSFSGLSLLGGIIQIGATTSTATAQSDGVTPSGTATTHLGAITIGGDSVSIGSDGLVVGPASANLSGLLAIPAALVNQLITALNLKVTVLPQSETTQAPSESITSGGLQISFGLPQNVSLGLDCSFLPSQLSQLGILCHLPDELVGLNFTFTLARVTAHAFASPPFTSALGSGPASAPSTTSLPSFASPSNFLSLPSTVGSTGALTPTATTTKPKATPGPSRLLGILPTALSSPIGAGLLIVLLALAAAFGLAFRRLATGMAAASPDDCPNEEEP